MWIISQSYLLKRITYNSIQWNSWKKQNTEAETKISGLRGLRLGVGCDYKENMKILWWLNCSVSWFWRCSHIYLDFPGSSDSKTSAYIAGDLGLIPGLGRSPGEGNGRPLQYSCLENPINGGASWATVHGVAKSRTWLNNFTFTRIYLYKLKFTKLQIR